MKKLLTICLLSFTFLLGSFSANAQEEKLVYLKEGAQVQALEMQKMLGLDKDQTVLVTRTIYAKNKSIAEDIEGKDLNNQTVMKLNARIHEDYKRNMMKILTDEQFNKFVNWESSKKKE